MIKFQKILLFFFAVFLVAPTVYGMPILPGSSTDGGTTWTASDAEGRSASAVFSIDGSSLMIVLTNTATKTSQPNEVLAGLFFDFAGYFGANKPHVEVASGSIVGGSITGGAGFNLDGEYGFLTGINGINGGLGDYGISSTAFDPEGGAPAGWTGFGTTTIIDSSKSYAPPSPDGAEFGLVGGDISGLVTSVNPYVKDSALIAWAFSGSFTVEDISQVNFLYGTDYAGAPVPEPATMLLLGSGLVGLAGLGRKRFFKKA